ncbi:MAG: hypothetical protein WCJ35_17250 [Planctomycetota bacterium]
MEQLDQGTDAIKTGQEILGYLNFSSGATDSRFLRNINHLFEVIDGSLDRVEPTWKAVYRFLAGNLRELHGRGEAFRQIDQAEAVLGLIFEKALLGYRQFHGDLLFHQSEEGLFQPLFIGRVCEAVLQQGGPWEETDRIVRDAIAQLNDYLGHRPVAVLRTQQKIQPYVYEWVRPIPLFIRGAGVAAGRYHDLISRALTILEGIDSSLQFDSMFDLALLEELAVDPRAYDFDHPVNKRPNYLFGQWDLGKLDNAGRCRRFVLQQVSLDAMIERIEHRGTLAYEEMLFEAAAVLAGTILMGARVSGNQPEAHDSSTTLSSLVQQIALYRDTFYEGLLSQMRGPHGERLRTEAVAVRQPFGGVRQHFNQHLARCRAEQLQHVHLAELFARMGYTEAAQRQAEVVSVASTRLKCDIHCRLTTAHLAIEEVHRVAVTKRLAGDAPGPRLEHAARLLEESIGLLHRAIECGALVDPWNILGFGGQYGLFPSPENSVYDHRVDELISLVSSIFTVGVQIQKEAAAIGIAALESQVSQRLDVLADWWDKFATTEIDSVDSFSGREIRESADHVASALRAWHAAGAASGDLAFWRERAAQFRSPKAYALVVDALLEQRSLVAAMALLVLWLSQADQIPLAEEDYSFHSLALDWMQDLWDDFDDAEASNRQTPSQRWALACKFLDCLEANAEEYWVVPRFELAGDESAGSEDEGDEVDDIYGAAYEDVTFRGSTEDDIEGEMLEGGNTGGETTDFELVEEAERIVGRLTFLATLAQLWKLAAVASFGSDLPTQQCEPVLAGWLDQAMKNRQQLLDLLSAVHRYRIPPPRGTQEALVEYERRRSIKEMLLEQIIATCVETGDAVRLIRVVMDRRSPAEGQEAWEEPAEAALKAVLRGDPQGVRKVWRRLISTFSKQTLLYVALTRNGHPQRIVASRGLQAVLRRLLAYLPRLGLLHETVQLISAIQEMETNHPVGPGAITEFDQMFKIGCRAVVRSLVAASEGWSETGEASPGDDSELIAFLEQATEALLRAWLIHSRGVRLSVLESVSSPGHWKELKRFVEQYGGDLFIQRFMNHGNLRGILHQGVDTWLNSLTEEPDEEDHFSLLEDLDNRIPREVAVRWLTIALEAIVENYAEYIDYNSTTTQSDRGNMLYTLLDYLRLRASYDRVAWNLQPVVLAHEVLVRSGHDESAEVWRAAVAERTSSIAEDHLKRFARLNRKYGMRLPSIADRLGERFVRPLVVDQLCSLIEPAIDEAHGKTQPENSLGSDGPTAFTRLEEGILEFTRNISGAGFDVPAWLETLEQEVDRVLSNGPEEEELPDPQLPVVQVQLTREEVRRQVQAMGGPD